MSRYKHIFFDLDRTLWDIETNSSQILTELAEDYKIRDRGIPSVDDFISHYKRINDGLWEQYHRDEIDKETLRVKRFRDAFQVYGIDDPALSKAFGDEYVQKSPLKNNLLPHTLDVLEYLHPKYHLHIITNGFEEVQGIKMEKSNIRKYFKEIVTSERSGFKKPDARIFQFTLNLAGAAPEESIMIGDSLEADIIGARGAGIDQVYYNPAKNAHQEKITYEIGSLHELLRFL